jgi:hypothetical protein
MGSTPDLEDPKHVLIFEQWENEAALMAPFPIAAHGRVQLPHPALPRGATVDRPLRRQAAVVKMM